MKLQAVHAEVGATRREEYLEAWFELAAALLAMNVRAELYEDATDPTRLVELVWLEAGHEAALSDDRVARLSGRLEGVCARREGQHQLLSKAKRGPSAGT